MVPGSSALANTSVKWPSSRRSTASTDATKSPAVSPCRYCLRDQVHGDLGVGVAGELHPGRLQLAAQRGEVLDDPVVHHRDLPGGVAMRVRVAVGGPAVGGPPGMAQPGVPAQRCRVGGVQRGLQVNQPAGAPAHRQSAAAVDQRDTGGVIAPVLHPAQRIHHDIAGGTVPDVADDSAHSATQYCSRRPGGANPLKFARTTGKQLLQHQSLGSRAVRSIYFCAL